MHSLVVNSAGLGSLLYSPVNPGDSSACGLSYADYLLNPLCWGTSWEDWQSAFYGTSALPSSFHATAAPPAPADIVTPVTGSDPAAINDLISGLVNKQAADQQAIDRNAVDVTSQNVNTVQNTFAVPSWFWFALAGAAVLVMLPSGGRRR